MPYFVLHLTVRTREYKTRQPSRLFLPWRVGACQNPAAREEEYKITKDGTRRLFVKRGVTDDPTGEAIQEKGRDIRDNTHAAPEGGQMRWKHGEMRRERLCHRRDRERESHSRTLGPGG